MSGSLENPSRPSADPDQEICVCFHVSRRKIENFIRLTRPRRAAQLAECFGAGTGCGWCRKYLVALFDAAAGNQSAEIPDPDDYLDQRRQHHQEQVAPSSLNEWTVSSAPEKGYDTR